MNKILWQSENGLYKLIDVDGRYLRLDNDKLCTCDYPILYKHNLKLAWERPYAIPKYVKTAVYRIMINQYMDEVTK